MDARCSQQQVPCWMGGQGTEPKEQNTQQSPVVGLSNALHALHS